MWATGAVDPGAVAAQMTAALHHRGPDSNGRWRSADGSLAFGHARLAIVDLSEHGHQPMRSRSGRFVVVYNGEVYNHLELRQQLGAHLPWRGHSDTETLLEAIEQWGLVRTLEAAVGMFAIAVWDCEKRTLSLARDRMGEKPLYYGFGHKGLAFASELKALRHCPGLDFRRDTEALRGFVEFGYIAGSRSAFVGIRKLPPASVLVLRSAGDTDATPVAYWSLAMPAADVGIARPTPADDVARISRLEALLHRSVKQQMLADVPVGAFLSGGIDSSLIASLMQKGSPRQVRTFSMGFGNGTDDELAAARRIAAHLGTDHTELLVTPEDVLGIVPKLAEIYDEPFADSSQVPTALLCRLTRRHVTVALSGDAGDELFGGYNRYLSAARLGGAIERWPHALRRGIGAALNALPSARIDAVAARARAWGMTSVPPSLGEKVARVARFVSARSGQDAYVGTLSQWLGGTTALPMVRHANPPLLEDCASAPLPQQMMRWDMQSYLPDDILVKVDRAAMAASLETRVPFLDHRIVEFAIATPLAFKIRAGRSKWMLRELLAREFPAAMFDRPKQGFTVPLDAWLRGPLRDWAESLLDARSLANSGLLDVARVRQTWEQHLSGRRNHQRSLWTILMLQAWIQRETSGPSLA
jgi:asparagine synthase (glutamine-hydrolysing)